jgi:hypothetical protein
MDTRTNTHRDGMVRRKEYIVKELTQEIGESNTQMDEGHPAEHRDVILPHDLYGTM